MVKCTTVGLGKNGNFIKKLFFFFFGERKMKRLLRKVARAVKFGCKSNCEG